ncbi:MAG TPA: ABC transporter permease, partial [Methanospirillum sp.]|uniref:ABC transporter permease n=1 Tax=Methanospirillum sp. TaxID=45200 RepID=UPI002C2D7258
MLQVIKKNILYHPIRNGALIFCFAIIAASLFSGNYILTSASEGVKSGITKLGADVLVVPKDYVGKSEGVILRGEPSMFFFDTDVTDAIAKVKGVSQVAPQVFITTVNGTFSSVPVQLIGFNQSLDFTITPWLKKNSHEPLKKDEVLVGNQIIPEVGETLKFYGHDFTITGKLEPTGTGVDTSVFMRIEDAYTMAKESKEKSTTPLTLPEGKPSTILVKVDNASETHEISFRIVDAVWGVKVLTPEVLISTVSGQLNSLTRILY